MGQVHRSQNLNHKDCSQIIKQMRYQSKPEDEELDQDVINSIKELGYSTIDVNRDIHVKNTHV